MRSLSSKLWHSQVICWSFETRQGLSYRNMFLKLFVIELTCSVCFRVLQICLNVGGNVNIEHLSDRKLCCFPKIARTDDKKMQHFHFKNVLPFIQIFGTGINEMKAGKLWANSFCLLGLIWIFFSGELSYFLLLNSWKSSSSGINVRWKYVNVIEDD